MTEAIQQYNLDSISKKMGAGIKIKSEQANYIEDPNSYVEEQFKIILWSKQREIIESVRDNKITLVRSCNDVGKTLALGCTKWWWFDVYAPHCRVITTATNYTAVRTVQWAIIRDLYTKIRHRFNNAYINLTDFTPYPDLYPKYLSVGLNPKIEGARNDPQAQATAFQGYHSKHTLFILDEAMTIHPAIFKAMEGSLLDEGSRALIVFNPTSNQGEVIRYEKYDSRVNVILINAFDLFNSPEYKENPERYNEMVNPEAAKILEKTFGRDSPLVQARIYGEYPTQDVDAAIKYNYLMKCVERFKDEDFIIGNINKIIFSWDVAELGGDFNVLGKLDIGDKGLSYTKKDKWKGKHSESLSRVYKMIIDEWNKQVNEFNKKQEEGKTEGLELPTIVLVVDAVGEGSHVPSIFADWFENSGIPITIVSFKGGSKANGVLEREEVDLLNKNSEAWYRTGLLIEDQIKSWLPIACDLDTETIGQLTSRKCKMQLRHNEPMVWMIESKADYKMRAGGKSPDEADAFIMACYAYSAESSVLMFTV